MITDRFNKRVLLYIAVWVLITLIHLYIAASRPGAVMALALSEAVVMNLVFALIGVGLWFLIKINDHEKTSAAGMILRLAAGSTVSISLWMGVSMLLLNNLPWSSPEYIRHLEDSMVIRVITGLLLFGIMITVFYLLISNENLKEHRSREQMLQSMLHETEIAMLRSQIKPHFLFNALNSISSLTITNPARAQEMVVNLSEFMRYSFSFSDNSMSSLDRELYHLRLYLEIEKVRFGGRLEVIENIDEGTGSWPMPPMILQPLVENAVKHGVYNTPGKSEVILSASNADRGLEVAVTNTYDSAFPGKRGTGTGLSNVMKRMRIQYGMPDLVHIMKSEETFTVTLKFPAYAPHKSTDN